MTKQELLQTAKPILFNTEMVQAILDGRKTVTRRLMKTKKYIPDDAEWGYSGFTAEGSISCRGSFYDSAGDKRFGESRIKLPYKKGDILYVRETWSTYSPTYGTVPKLVYKADYAVDWNVGETTDGEIMSDFPWCIKWRSSIHMPKEAARIFLKVTDIRVERLQDIDEEQAKAEGANCRNGKDVSFEEKLQCSSIDRFAEIWNSTINKKDLDIYGWEANPWVWVIEFERIETDERKE